MPITAASFHFVRRLSLAALLVLGALAGAALPASAQQVVVLVNGEPITTLDIEQRSKFIQLSTRKTPARQEVIDELINEKLKIHEARRFHLTASDTDVDNAFAGMASGMGQSAQQLAQMLASHGTAAGTLKSKIRADIVWGQLVRGRYQQSLQVGERDILNALETKKKEDKESYEYILRPILLIVAKGSPPARFEERRREADALKARFQNCDEGVRLARALRDVAVREPVRKHSADLPAPLRGVLDGIQIGRLTNPEQTAQGIELFALCGKKESKADSPGRREAQNEIFAQRFKNQATRYLQQIRSSAMIEYR